MPMGLEISVECPNAFSEDVKRHRYCLLYRLMSFLLDLVAPVYGRI